MTHVAAYEGFLVTTTKECPLGVDGDVCYHDRQGRCSHYNGTVERPQKPGPVTVLCSAPGRKEGKTK
jgi:hypothetical protein